MTHAYASGSGTTATTEDVLREEMRWLRGTAPAGGPTQGDADDPDTLSALCLSGGGIRSATFCLGVAQGLAQKGMLGQFHYLSTVSGGGYFGSWLTAWIKREGHAAVMSQLAQPGPAPHHEPTPVRRLRAYTNYLSPVSGLSADSLALAATFIRNLVLNWLVLLPLLAAALMLPRVHLALLNWRGPGDSVSYGLLALAALLVVTTIAYIVADLPGKVPVRDPKNRFALFCFAPLVLACVLVSWVAAWNPDALKSQGALPMAGVGAALYVVAIALGMVWRRKRGLAPRPNSLWDAVFTLASGAVGGLALYGVASFVPRDTWDEAAALAGRRELYATLCVPVLLAVFWAGGTVYAGLTCRIKGEDYREWWARSAAWWLGAGTVWVIAAVLVIYAPRWLMALPWLQAPSGPQAAGAGAALLGILSGAAGYWSKNGAQIKKQATGFIEATGMKLLDLASLLFIVALLLALSIAVSCSLRQVVPGLNDEVVLQQSDEAMLRQAGWPPPLSAASAAAAAKAAPATPAPAASAPVAARAHVAYSVVLRWPAPLSYLAIALGLLIAGVGVSAAIGVNTFSLHSMYGNRLARAYLGASNRNRRPHWFTGFDDADNPKFADMATDPHDKPPAVRKLFHVVNVALNLVKPAGDRLEWQQRMAAPFTASALHCGSSALGAKQAGAFVPTAHYGDGEGGMSLGRAMAISGAAASPNMGYHTSKLVAFVMTFFNIRLGWWTPNPLQKFHALWTQREPHWGVGSMLQEASAGATADHGFVYLSDGGHFENLGLYEMVRRGCRRIVVVDASCDVDYEFEDLQDALRKIHIDLGVRIDFVDPLPTPEHAKASGRHVAVAQIRYDLADPLAKPGRLVYIKPVLTGDEPLDVACYAAANNKPGRAFPHQTTADQFFNESQFESYRVLGMHSVEKTFEDWAHWPRPAPAAGGARIAPPRRLSPSANAAVDALKSAATPPRTEGGGASAAGLLPAAARGLQSAGQGALLATALTVGGVLGVSGTVGLRDSEVTLKEGAKVTLASTDLKLNPDALEIKLSEADRKALEDQLKLTVDALKSIEKSNSDYQTLTVSLTNIIGKLGAGDPARQVKALEEIRTAIRDIRIPEPARTVSLDATTQAALQSATASLRSIEAAVKDTPPRRTIRAVSEGNAR